MSEDMKTISYQCNKCQKRRTLKIPSRLLRIENIKEILEFIDVHKCEQNELSAVKCFIDRSLVVRSQFHMKSTHFGYEADRDFSTASKEEDLYTMLGIPIPKKTEIIDREVDSKKFKPKKLVGIEIKDKIRKCNFIIGKRSSGKIIPVTSILGFVEIKTILEEKIADSLYKNWKQQVESASEERKQRFPFSETRKWMQKVADTLESMLYLDEEMLTLIAEYLDKQITVEPNEKDLLELDLMINSAIVFPQTSKELLSRFTTYGGDVFQNMSIIEKNYYKDLLEHSLENSEKSLLYLYNERSAHLTFTEFLSALSNLILKGYLTINKLEFK